MRSSRLPRVSLNLRHCLRREAKSSSCLGWRKFNETRGWCLQSRGAAQKAHLPFLTRRHWPDAALGFPVNPAQFFSDIAGGAELQPQAGDGLGRKV